MEALLSDLPPEVSEAYERILEKSKKERRTETLLQIVLAAIRPLNLDEANVALTLGLEKDRIHSHADLESYMWPKESFKDAVKNFCGLLISVHESRLSFIHQTAREFLSHRERRGNWQGRFCMTKSHGKMASICLKYLSFLDEQEPVKEIRAKCPLAQYAAQYWMDHAKLAETEKDVQDDVLKFLLENRRAFTVWGKLFDPDTPWAEYPRLVRPEMAPPLYYVSTAGLQHIAKLLLKRRVDVDEQGGAYGNALQTASRKGHKEVVRLLLERGANVNAQGAVYGSALQIACVCGNTELAELLLEKGADVNAQGGKYGNALQAACIDGSKKLVETLLERGADVNAQGGIHGSALQIASDTRNWELVELLLERGAHGNVKDPGYALHAASDAGKTRLVKLLLERGTDVNEKGGEYGNALQAASVNGHKEVAELLLEKGAYVNAQGGKYGSALQAASVEGHKEVVKLLLERGADVNTQGGWYGTAFHVASAEGHKDVVELLLERGADANKVQGSGFDIRRLSATSPPWLVGNPDLSAGSPSSPAGIPRLSFDYDNPDLFVDNLPWSAGAGNPPLPDEGPPQPASRRRSNTNCD